MTSTQQETQALPIGQAVGQAEASLTRLLNLALAGAGVTRQVYLALQRLNALGGQATREACERDLHDWLDLDAAAASRLASELISAGFAVADGSGDGIRMTTEGQALRAGILAEGRQLTGPVLAAIDPADLRTTIRTLEVITQGVREIPAGPANTEGIS